jgi:glycosyltransferase involved in cell wall biosynthesis
MSQYLGKSKRPIISVVIPTYNEEKDIEDLLESLNKQTFKNFEVIIVDNYSKDKTIEIVKRFKRKLNLRIYKIKSNVSRARNFGAEKSRGKIIVFLDADNIVQEDYLFNIYKSFEPDAVCSAYYGWKKHSSINYIKKG